jgi:hypothetical protein
MRDIYMIRYVTGVDGTAVTVTGAGFCKKAGDNEYIGVTGYDSTLIGGNKLYNGVMGCD